MLIHIQLSTFNVNLHLAILFRHSNVFFYIRSQQYLTTPIHSKPYICIILQQIRSNIFFFDIKGKRIKLFLVACLFFFVGTSEFNVVFWIYFLFILFYLKIFCYFSVALNLDLPSGFSIQFASCPEWHYHSPGNLKAECKQQFGCNPFFIKLTLHAIFHKIGTQIYQV